MEEVPRPKKFTFRGAWFRRGASEVHLILADDTTAPPGLPDPGPARYTGLATHLAFEVDDLDAVVEHLQRHAVPIFGGPVARGDGVTQIYVHDPDGYLVEFFKWTGEEGNGAERGAARPVYRGKDDPADDR